VSCASAAPFDGFRCDGNASLILEAIVCCFVVCDEVLSKERVSSKFEAIGVWRGALTNGGVGTSPSSEEGPMECFVVV